MEDINDVYVSIEFLRFMESMWRVLFLQIQNTETNMVQKKRRVMICYTFQNNINVFICSFNYLIFSISRIYFHSSFLISFGISWLHTSQSTTYGEMEDINGVNVFIEFVTSYGKHVQSFTPTNPGYRKNVTKET